VKGQNKDKDFDEREDTPENLILPTAERKCAHAFPAGTQAGNFFHEVFENIDFMKVEHLETVELLLKKHGINKADPIIAHEIILATLNAQLNKHKGESLRLCELEKKDLIAEMEFHINAPDFNFKELGNHLAEVNPECPFAQYLQKTNELNPIQIDQRFLKGFIDLTFKKDNQFFILDWKSNLLTGQQNGFESKILRSAMDDSDYVLQYHLYTLALNRFLKNTLQNEYRYSENFGGVYYLFIRGMHRPKQADDGIFFDCPKESLIDAMDHFLTFEQR
jgi:exodeoxyribonuclease V beta subunit